MGLNTIIVYYIKGDFVCCSLTCPFLPLWRGGLGWASPADLASGKKSISFLIIFCHLHTSRDFFCHPGTLPRWDLYNYKPNAFVSMFISSPVFTCVPGMLERELLVPRRFLPHLINLTLKDVSYTFLHRIGIPL